MGGTVRVVFNALYLGRNAVFGALEIDFAVMLLMTTANVTSGDSSEIISAACLGLLLEERTVRLAFVQALGHHLNLVATTC
jgi:hypothetical protein